MKITIEFDDGTTKVFSDVTEAYVSVRLPEMLQKGEDFVTVLQAKSFSWGDDVREIVKEVRQSIVELDEQLALARGAQRRVEADGDTV